MTGSEFAAIRKSLGLTTVQWGRALGYSGEDASVSASVRRIEARGVLGIPTTIARLTHMFACHGIPPGWIEH